MPAGKFFLGLACQGVGLAQLLGTVRHLLLELPTLLPNGIEAVDYFLAALQKRIEIVGAVGRECFAPRLSIVLRDGRRLVGEYHGRELMWDFARDAHELRRFVPGLPIASHQYDRLVAAISGLDKATSVDEIIRLTLPDA